MKRIVWGPLAHFLHPFFKHRMEMKHIDQIVDDEKELVRVKTKLGKAQDAIKQAINSSNINSTIDGDKDVTIFRNRQDWLNHIAKTDILIRE